jgi:hypothetical protein
MSLYITLLALTLTILIALMPLIGIRGEVVALASLTLLIVIILIFISL